MQVLKFGGTSVRDSKWMDKVIDIATTRLEKGSVVLVSSAMAGITDQIIHCYSIAEEGKLNEAMKELNQMAFRHEEAAESFLSGDNLSSCKLAMQDVIDQNRSLLKGIALLKICSPRSMDALLSMGERLSTLLLFHRAQEKGLVSQWLDARELIFTDSNYSAAQVDFTKTNQSLKKAIDQDQQILSITQGFIGSDPQGVTTTLGRGGSDYTAAIIGAALEATAIEIWTDVSGIMTSDPRSVEGVRPLSHVTYTEAGELAYFGAKVVHPATIQPAVRKNIPLFVLNTGHPEDQGTRIDHHVIDPGLKAIAAKKNITLISISSSRMLNAYGFLSKIFQIFDGLQIPVDLLSTSEVSVSLTIDSLNKLEELNLQLSELGQVTIEREQSIISLVGQDLWKNSQFISKVFAELEDIPIRMISLGGSDTNLSLVVADEQRDRAVQLLHDGLLKE